MPGGAQKQSVQKAEIGTRSLDVERCAVTRPANTKIWSILELFPVTARSITDMAVFQNFSVRKLLGLVEAGSNKTDNGHSVARFLEVDANMPQVSIMLADPGFSA
jgi:hypothetical protein